MIILRPFHPSLTVSSIGFFMNILRFVFVVCSFLMRVSNAEIVEVKTMAQVQEHIKKHTQENDCWVVWDLDNTVMCPANEDGFGGDFWFAASLEKLMKAGLPLFDAVDKILPEYFTIQYGLPMKPVEDHVITVIDELQKQNITVLGLTARSGPLVERSVVQLNEINVSFAKTHPQSNNPKMFDLLSFGARYYEGILFCDNNTKGEVLTALLNNLDRLPKKIVFIDDREKHVACVKKAAENLGITFIGLRYGYLDEQARNYVLPIKKDNSNAELPVQG